MSNLAVRNWFNNAIQVLLPDAPFQKTIGVLWQQKNLPEVWSTVEYGNAADQRMSVGKRALWQEVGSVTVNLLGKSGFGEEPLLAMLGHFADAMRDLQEQLVEASGQRGKLEMNTIGTPNCEPFEDGNWLIATVVCVYTYSSVRGAADEE